MPLPVAHGLVSATLVAAITPRPLTRRAWGEFALGVALGICPDFDFALNLVPALGGGWHHGPTHSLAFALSLGSLVAWLTRQWRLQTVLLYSAVIFSHALLDFFLTESRGVALWWPLTNFRYALRVPNPIAYSWGGPTLWEMVADLARISVQEVLLYAPLLLFVLWLKRRGKRAVAE